ncbi:MAG: hypothetical protein IPK82_09255 [Polyangiaceae bacterium]|nr:hypothetical protein [Polyangiaceae bacterium]
MTIGTVAMVAPACDGGEPVEDCVGGFITPEGDCVGKCSPDKCVADNTCVANACQLKCDSHKDCFLDGSQDCVTAKEDETDADVTVCQFAARSAGTGTACPFAVECANWLSCPENGTCLANQCGGDPAACVLDSDACGGASGCVIGKCQADGAPCRVNCQTECTPWLTCETKGEADAEAYCTKRDCAADTDCAGGYYCGIVRDPHEICGSSPKKGDNSFCGQTSEPCITPGTDGTSRFEGSLCMLRKSCLKRDAGTPCTTDLDCSLIDGQACVNFGGETRCAPKCGVDSDCPRDAACDPTLLACVPRFGKWVGAGGGFCEPCKNDEDCGSKGTSWACSELSGGMRACFDQSFPDTCNTDSDCPKSPSGKPGACLDETYGVDSTSSVYKRCYLPINSADSKTTCW